MKVLFLDVDGVLNSAEWFEQNRSTDSDYLGLRSVNPAAVKMIVYVLRATGSMLVLSSTWRLVDDYVQTLKNADLPIIAKTPVLDSNNRGEEIKAWLDTHPGVTHYAIVDDDADAGDCGLRDHFVRTTFQRGLEMSHVDRLLQLLGTQPPDTFPKPKA